MIIKAKQYARKALEALLRRSLEEAAKKQGLEELCGRLRRIVPDISNQYSTRKLDSSYLKTKVRNQHAFQISLIGKVINEFKAPRIADIGDSCGTHIQYIKGIYPQVTDCLSINLDEAAVEKIKAKGLQAVGARAEELKNLDLKADILLCFELLEHLSDPNAFLHTLAGVKQAKYLILTVPFLKESRVGLHHIRNLRADKVCAENTHIFELNPVDWKLLARHAGWDIVYERIYLQYPRFSLLGLTRPLWQKYDFTGFYGLILKKDDSWAIKYSNWP